jgi:transcriptional regulator with XRE-family HTH domain
MEVYWIDRERVASSDLVMIMGDHPSFGVGQEAEIAANAGVPIVLCHSRGLEISKMLKGLPAHIIATLEFDHLDDLAESIERFFRQNRERLSLNRRKREREYHLRVGNRIRHRREALQLNVEDLASRAEINVELINSVESRPEQQSNFSLVNLRRVARALNIALAELVRDQSSRDEQFASLFRSSVANLRAYATKEQLSYEVYRRLKDTGRAQLQSHFNAVAFRSGEAGITPWDEARWRALYVETLSTVDTQSTETLTLPLFPDDSVA